MGDLPGGVFFYDIQCLIPDGRPTLQRSKPISLRWTPYPIGPRCTRLGLIHGWGTRPRVFLFFVGKGDVLRMMGVLGPALRGVNRAPVINNGVPT